MKIIKKIIAEVPLQSTKMFLLSICIGVFLLSFSSADSGFGYDNPELPNIPTPDLGGAITSTTYINSSNDSDYWDGIDIPNATQMETTNQTLSIRESWLTTFVTALWNTIFGTKTTDDLTEGTTNLYDNQTWNETYANGLYGSGGGNATWNQSFANELYVEITGDTMTGGLTLEGANILINNDGSAELRTDRGGTAYYSSHIFQTGGTDE